MKWSEIVNQNIWLSSKVSIPYAGVILVALNHNDRGSHVEAACINYVTVTLFGQKDPTDISSCLKRCSIDTSSYKYWHRVFLSAFFFRRNSAFPEEAACKYPSFSLPFVYFQPYMEMVGTFLWCKAINFIHTSDCTGPLNFFGKQCLSS